MGRKLWQKFQVIYRFANRVYTQDEKSMKIVFSRWWLLLHHTYGAWGSLLSLWRWFRFRWSLFVLDDISFHHPLSKMLRKKNFLKEIFWVLSNCSRFPIRFPRPQPGNEARPPLLFVLWFVFSVIHGSKWGSTSVPQIKEQKPGRSGNEDIFAAPAFLLETEWQLGTTVPTKPRFSYHLWQHAEE